MRRNSEILDAKFHLMIGAAARGNSAFLPPPPVWCRAVRVGTGSVCANAFTKIEISEAADRCLKTSLRPEHQWIAFDPCSLFT
jgi:hypothetical protein